MAKSVKLKDNHFIDSTGIVHEKGLLSTLLNKMNYNLITNGDAVKTGKKVDGKVEYVKRYKITGINSAGDYEVPLGFTLSDVIVTDIRGTTYSTSNNYFTINSGVSTAMTYDYIIFCDNRTNGVKIRTYNANFSEATVDVYYTYRN